MKSKLAMSALALSALLVCLFGIACKKPLSNEVLERRVAIKPDRFMSQMERREHVTVSELVSLLSDCSDESGSKLGIKQPKILSTVKFTIDGKDIERENLAISVTRARQTYSIELIFNRRTFLDVDELEYELQIRNDKNEIVDSDRWFNDLYKLNEREIRDLTVLKNKKVPAIEPEQDLFAVHQALNRKSTVRDLKVIEIAGAYYFIGKNDEADFILYGLPSRGSPTYGIGYFLPRVHQGFPLVMFVNSLFNPDGELPNDEDVR